MYLAFNNDFLLLLLWKIQIFSLLQPLYGGIFKWTLLDDTAALHLQRNCLRQFLDSLILRGKLSSCASVHCTWQIVVGFLFHDLQKKITVNNPGMTFTSFSGFTCNSRRKFLLWNDISLNDPVWCCWKNVHVRMPLVLLVDFVMWK